MAQALALDLLAAELKLPQKYLEAMEVDRWQELPPGRERPMVRQVAARLGLDGKVLEPLLEQLPGGPGEIPRPDPRVERMERLAMGVLALGSLGLVAWLLIPGPRLRGERPAPTWLEEVPRTPVPPPPPRVNGPYPVLGEMLPEAPRTEQGVLLSLRSQDACEATVEGEDGFRIARTVRVGDPWRLRVRPPFKLSLSNAGVVKVEVAGQAIAHGAAVGSAWSGSFDAEGRWLRPRPAPSPVAPGGVPGGESEPEPE